MAWKRGWEERLGRRAREKDWGKGLRLWRGTGERDWVEGLGRRAGKRDLGEGLGIGEGAEPDESRTNAKERLWVERLWVERLYT